MKKELIKKHFRELDQEYRKIDRTHIRKTKNIRLIPPYRNRKGGKVSYAEWAYVIGIFQTIIFQNLLKKTGNQILDIGCGTGLLGIASEPFTSDGGSYTGIDVMEHDVNFCKNHYQATNYNFIHLDVHNQSYASHQKKNTATWPIQSNSQDLVTGLSVWTHFNEPDAIFYFKEIHRVLKEKGKAIITFFYLDDLYQNSLEGRKDNKGRFHRTNQQRWIFDVNAYDSENWLSPKWVKNPEDAIGITPIGLDKLINASNLKLDKYLPGNWKEQPGIYFQDILIFSKN